MIVLMISANFRFHYKMLTLQFFVRWIFLWQNPLLRNIAAPIIPCFIFLQQGNSANWVLQCCPAVFKFFPINNWLIGSDLSVTEKHTFLAGIWTAVLKTTRTVKQIQKMTRPFGQKLKLITILITWNQTMRSIDRSIRWKPPEVKQIYFCPQCHSTTSATATSLKL